MRFLVHGKIPAEVVAQIQSDVLEQENLAEMMSWAMAQPAGTFSPKVVADVIVQDEFTHDVIVPRTDGLVLVYDAT